MDTAYINKRKEGQLVTYNLGSIVAVGRNSLQKEKPFLHEFLTLLQLDSLFLRLKYVLEAKLCKTKI